MDNYGLVSIRHRGTKVTRVALLDGTRAQALRHTWFIQRDRPDEDFYFEPFTIENPLTLVHSPKAAKKWIGQKIFMWTGGYHPDTGHNEEGTLTKFNLQTSLSRTNNPWFALMSGSIAGELYYGQASDPRKSWYIIPEVTLADPSIASVFSRIFLGSR